MHGIALVDLDKRSAEPPDRVCPQQSGRMTRIPVCHVSEGSAWAGAEVQMATLLRGLSRRSEIALCAIVLNEGRLVQELRDSGVAVLVVKESEKSFAQVVFECAEFVRSRNIQVLHSHNYKENLIALLVSRLCKVPYLIRTEHGHPEPYSVARNLKHWCVLKTDSLAAKCKSARIVTVSADLGEYWKRRVGPEKVTVLHNAVDLERVSSKLSPAEAKRRLGIPDSSFVVGIAARLECIKRHDLFLAAASCLADKIPGCRFLIAGEGRQKESLQRLTTELRLQDRVALLGAREDVYDILRAMDVLLICSDHEGIPMVMLEAMALGVAVVSRRVGGIPEIIQDGLTGVLVPADSPRALADACIALLEDPDRRNSLIQAARNEIWSRYSADRNAGAIAGLYQSISRPGTSSL